MAASPNITEESSVSRRAISLTRELWLILRALKGQRHLADHAFDLPDGPAAREILSALSATIALVEDRLLMLDRVIRDEVDAALLWSSVNDAGPLWREHQDEDVRLRAWGARHALKKAREELTRAKARRAREKQKGAGRKAGARS